MNCSRRGLAAFTLLAGLALAAPARAQDYFIDSLTLGPPWGSLNFGSQMDTVFGQGNWTNAFYEAVDPTTVFVPGTSFVYLEGGESNADQLNAFLGSNLPAIEAWVAGGGHLFLNAAPTDGGNIDLGFGGVTLNYPGFAAAASAVDPDAPIFQGPFGPTGSSFTGDFFNHSFIASSGPVLTNFLIDDNGNYPLAGESYGAGYVMFGGLADAGFQQPNSMVLHENIIAFVAAVPEPSSLALCGVAGALGLGALARRRLAGRAE